MKHNLGIIVLLILSQIMFTAHADEKEIRGILEKSMPSMKINSIKPSEIKGLQEIDVGSNVFYVSDDGKYLIQGHIIDIAARKDLTEIKLNDAHKNALEKLGKGKMIVFEPKIHKYTVTIFTDIDCGYCRKLHSEIDSYLAEGIAVQYVFFPRAGKGSDSYKKAVSVWCAKDQKAALTAAKKGEIIEAKTCDNPIDEHMQLGADFEVGGTPMIISGSGVTFPGYLPAKQLLEALEDSEKGTK
jgi:thiol:disulfide interchange protein DsbC